MGLAPARHGFWSRLHLINAAWLTVFASLALSLVGVYAIDVARNMSPQSASDLAPQATKQLVLLAVSLVAAAIVVIPRYRLFMYVATPLLVLVIGLLIFVLVPAVPTSIVAPRNGARSWINLGFTDFQPSELAKIAFVLVLAKYLRYRDNYRRFLGLLPPALIAFVPVALITLQPDLGTASLFIPALFAVLVAAGAKLKHLAVVVLIAALAAPAAFPLLRPHQQQRIVALFQQIEGDRSAAQDLNFQSFTAQTMVGAGGAAGLSDDHARALLYYNRLPERHNDMIFAVIVNRFGMLGGLVVFGLYLLWMVGAFLTAGLTRDPFARLLVVGLAAFIAGQMFINIGMNIGLVPIIGVTMPFVSYGGSSLLTVWLMTGLIFNVAMRRPRTLHKDSFEFGDHSDE